MRLAIDIGARFADFCLAAPDGLRIAKIPLKKGLIASVRAGFTALDIAPRALAELRISSTRPLNQLLTRAPAPVALICTAGFEDTLDLARQDRTDLYAPVAHSAAPGFLAPRGRRFAIGGRIGADGTEVEPLDRAALGRVIGALRSDEAQAVAVSLLFAHRNPAHERAVGAALEDALPGLPVRLSHRVDPGPREYERTVATLLDAWMTARAVPELAALVAELRAEGLTGRVLWGDGRGTLREESILQMEPTALLLGGPAAAATSMQLAEAPAVMMDIGSRSTDLALLGPDGPAVTEPGKVAGIPLRCDLLDNESLPFGGETAVTLKGERLSIDTDGSPLDDYLRAMGRFGDSDRPRSADPVIAAVAAHLAEAVVRFATRRNVDPMRARLVISGGAGSLLAAEIAAVIGLPSVWLPAVPAAAGAFGLLGAPMRRSIRRDVDLSLHDLTDEVLAANLEALAGALEVVPDKLILTIAPRSEMHGHVLVLSAPPRSVGALREAFREAYLVRYGIDPPGPGQLISIFARHDIWPATPEISVPAIGRRGPARVETVAGAIWLPAGWSLRGDAHGYLLEAAK